MYSCIALSILHVSTFMYRFGPLGRHWCMRYEAKHSYFKRLAKNAYNFKNIAKTLAKRHQHLMCYHLNSAGEGHGFLDEATDVGRGQCSSFDSRVLSIIRTCVVVMYYIPAQLSLCIITFPFQILTAKLLQDADALQCLHDTLPHLEQETPIYR